MMTTIHIDQGEPEAGWWRVTFTKKEGKFTEADLRAVKQRTKGVGHFGGGDPTNTSLVSDKAYEYRNLPRIVLRVLRVRYPSAFFTTYGNSTKRLLGEDVEQIRSGRS